MSRADAVLGIDTDEAKVDRLNRVESYTKHIGMDAVASAKVNGIGAPSDLARSDEPGAIPARTRGFKQRLFHTRGRYRASLRSLVKA